METFRQSDQYPSEAAPWLETNHGDGRLNLLEQFFQHGADCLTKTSTGGEKKLDAPEGSKKTPEAPKSEWTIAINLAVNLDNAGPNGRMGAEDKINRLKTLEEATKGKPVTIIAQAVVPTVDAADKAKKGVVLKRYRIRDGKCEELSETRSNGFKDDLKDLLSVTCRDYPASKVGLVVNAHGLGNRGLLGDSGEISLPDFERAVRDGISGSGHEKLDLVNLDACLMAEHSALDKMTGITKRLVASAEIESADAADDVDGQDLNAWLKALLQDPTMDAEKLGRKIIAKAADGANDSRKTDGIRGTPTLALFDLSQERSFKTALDELGERLAKTMESEKAKESIHELIDALPTFATLSIFPDPMKNQERDLKAFLNAVEKAVKNKELDDPDGALLKSVQSLQEKSAKMTEAFHGADRLMSSEFSFGAQSRLKYGELGGLSVFLPSRAVLDVHQEAVRQSEVRSLFWPCRSTDSFTIRKMNAAEIPKNFEAIEKQLRDHPDTLKYWQTTARPAVENLQRQLNQSEEKFVGAAGPVKTAAEKLVTMPPFSQQVEDFKKKFNPKELYEKEGVKDDKGWNKFLKKLSQFKS